MKRDANAAYGRECAEPYFRGRNKRKEEKPFKRGKRKRRKKRKEEEERARWSIASITNEKVLVDVLTALFS
jgi:hypothetical protein